MRIKRIMIGITLASGILLALAMLYGCGFIHFNRPDKADYPVRGVDVSAYQGKIDWNVLPGQDITFAFIKATEGSSFVDPRFAENWKQAQESGLRIGAYHFFSFDSAGKTQAENFIRNVNAHEGMLPPVIDLEFYGNYHRKPASKDAILPQLNEMLSQLEAHYGMKPIIYATMYSYSLYLKDAYGAYDIWIRNVFTPASLPDGRNWTFWQYSDKEQLNGYSGEERFIDMNVFNGSSKEFLSYAG